MHALGLQPSKQLAKAFGVVGKDLGFVPVFTSVRLNIE
jgi:hypothetical protein